MVRRWKLTYDEMPMQPSQSEEPASVSEGSFASIALALSAPSVLVPHLTFTVHSSRFTITVHSPHRIALRREGEERAITRVRVDGR